MPNILHVFETFCEFCAKVFQSFHYHSVGFTEFSFLFCAFSLSLQFLDRFAMIQKNQKKFLHRANFRSSPQKLISFSSFCCTLQHNSIITGLSHFSEVEALVGTVTMQILQEVLSRSKTKVTNKDSPFFSWIFCVSKT